MEKKCQNCNRPYFGKSTAKFCSGRCRAENSNKKRALVSFSFLMPNGANPKISKKIVDDQVKKILKNREILQDFYIHGKKTTRLSNLIMFGFEPEYMTKQELFENNTIRYYLDYSLHFYGQLGTKNRTDAVDISFLNV